MFQIYISLTNNFTIKNIGYIKINMMVNIDPKSSSFKISL